MELTAPELVFFWFFLCLSLLISGYGANRLFAAIKKGRPSRFEKPPLEGISDVLVYVLGQKSNFKNHNSKDFTALGHIFIFWGAVSFAFYYLVFIVIGPGFGFATNLRTNVLGEYYLLGLDLMGPFLFTALLLAGLRRLKKKPARLGPGFDAYIFMALLLGALIFFGCYYLYEAVFLIQEGFTVYLPVTSIFAGVIENMSLEPASLAVMEQLSFWGQALLGMGVLVYAPFSHHKHPIFSPISVYLREKSLTGAMKPLDFEAKETFGVSKIYDFEQKMLLQTLACTHCGRCTEVCPASQSGKDFSPKGILLEISHSLTNGSSKKSYENTSYWDHGLISGQDALWSCTTCGACVEVCPVFNRPLDHVLELRRGMIFNCQLEQGHQSALEKLSRNFNPWGVKWNKRMNKLDLPQAKEDQSYDCLYWVGCAASCDDTAMDTAKAMAGILKKAGLSFAVLGSQEKCCGDFARRIGDEGLYQKLAKENIETLNRFDFKFILTHCPHCYNTLSHEYPDFGAEFRVLHHSDLLESLIAQRKIKLHGFSEKVIYHDPCYLGRHNQKYDSPRRVLNEVFENVQEFPRAREKSFCCGAGGGHMWKQEESGEMISLLRIKEALSQNTRQLATACPFCLLMFNEAKQLNDDNRELVVRDLAQIVEQQII